MIRSNPSHSKQLEMTNDNKTDPELQQQLEVVNQDQADQACKHKNNSRQDNTTQQR